MPSDYPEQTSSNKKNLLKAYQVMFMFAMLCLSIYIFTIREQLAELATYGYIGIFVINLIGSASVLVPVPSPVASIIGASIYNPLTVGIVSGLGAAFGEMTSYFTGRSGTFIVENMRMYKWLERLMLRHKWLVIFTFSFVPNPFFDLTGMLAGIMRLPIKLFFPVMLIGKLCKFILLAYLTVFAIDAWFL